MIPESTCSGIASLILVSTRQDAQGWSATNGRQKVDLLVQGLVLATVRDRAFLVPDGELSAARYVIERDFRATGVEAHASEI